ncbi:MAG TPA: hypothetical protein GXZ91_04670 [Christensenellaceae bacterium]|nr:hypothetical protein [Christensenellaceae bacterium]
MNKIKKFYIKNTVIIVILLAMFVLLVVSSEKIEEKYALKTDLSFNSITMYGDTTEKLLENLSSPVHVYAIFTPGEEDYNLIALLERYSAKSEYFTFSIENLAENPMLVHAISDSIYDGTVSGDCLIVHGKSTNRTRILNEKDYIKQSYDMDTGSFVVDGATYESSLSEAISYVASEELPTIYMLSGHGELSLDEVMPLVDFLKKCNYSVEQLDIENSGSIPADGLLMILSPGKDLTNNELSHIMEYANKGGSLFISTDYDDPANLPNFNSLLRYYGVSIIPGIVSADEKDTASYIENPLYLMPYMQHSEITSTLISLEQDRLILVGARAFEMENASGKDLQLTSILKSGNAYIHDYSFDGQLIGNENAEPSVYDLAVLSRKAGEYGEQSIAFIIGNSSVLVDEWLYTNSYSREFLLSTIQGIYTKHPETLDIQARPAFRKSMDIKSAFVPLSIIIIVPILIAIFAAAVLIKRKKL